MWWAIWDAMSRSRATGQSAPKDPTRVPIALARGSERVMAAHIGQALELVELSRGRISPERAIEVYCRLALLAPSSTEEVRTRALSALANAREEKREDTGIPERLAWRRSRLDGLRRRRDDELRDWVDLQAARSRSVVIEAHVRSAIEFVDIMAGRLNRPQAIAFYLRTANVPGHLVREVETFAMERLARRHLPLPFREPEARGPTGVEDEEPDAAGDQDPDTAGDQDPDTSEGEGPASAGDQEPPVSEEAGGGSGGGAAPGFR
jgi:hypothetical protein